MPVYDYRCDNGHRFEAIQSMSDAPLTRCDQCGAPAERVLHAPAIHFKGSGFHNTDYGTRNRPKEAPAPAAGGSAAASGASPGASDGGAKSSGSGTTVGLDKA